MSSSRLLKHTAYNLIGLGLPLVVAVFTIPLLVRNLGDARFGLLTLMWAVVSYFGLFDLGLGRAVTQQLALALDQRDLNKAGLLIGTSAVLLALLGVAAGFLMAIIAPWGVDILKSVPDKAEALGAMYAMSVAMPAIVLTSGFRGVLESAHAFGVINLIRLPMGLFTFLGPLLVVWAGFPRLDWIAWVLVAGRIVGCVAHAWCAWRALPQAHGVARFEWPIVKTLSASGGWLTVSNVISPLMGYVDRFIIGALISASAVAYYVTPYELVTKLWIIPGALTTVLFPTFTSQLGRPESRVWSLFGKSVRWVFTALLPLTALLALFAREILALWLGDSFAQQSALLLQVFSIGVLINSMAHIPFTLIQSAGRAKVTALIHSIELPLFIVILLGLVNLFGLRGAAIAWLTRIVIDAALMFIMCSRQLGWKRKELPIRTLLPSALIGCAAFSGLAIDSLLVRAIWFTSLVLVWGFYFVAAEMTELRTVFSQRTATLPDS